MEYGADTNQAMTDSGEIAVDDPLADFPREASPWLDLITDAERAFRTYNDKADSIDKLYANLEKLCAVRIDREYQMFWANLEVVKPSIYSRSPQPVVVPRFKDMRELPRIAAEVVERCLQTTFDSADIHDTLVQVRDDMSINARGVPWVRYVAQGEENNFSEGIEFDHVDRKDFLHEPCRKWKECGWVAKRAYMNREKGRERFGDLWLRAEFKDYKPEDGANYDGEKKAQVWEIWHKGKGVVVWVSPGMQEILDVQPPILTLEGFYPCPKPAYSTVQRGTMIPVPDMLYYKDQLEEINELTARIAGLAESLRLKGFFSAGEDSLSSAVEKALKSRDNSAVLIPVPAHLMNGQAFKDAVLWLPVVEIATTIQQLIELRKQVIDDVYQITGISDIMRGSTQASETLGAQQLKSQYGSIRIKERQNEIVRVSRDLTRIAAEVIAENFQPETLLSMSQMQLPTQQQVMEQQQAMMMQAQAAGQPAPQPKPQITIDAIVSLLREQRVRPFVLDIETDSTIQPDEDAEKRRRTEFLTAMGGFISQAMPLVMQVPQAAPLMAETLKFAASGYRAGRQLEGAIEQFAEQIKQSASQPKPPPPEAQKAEAEVAIMKNKAANDDARGKVELQLKQADFQIKQIEGQIKMLELQTAQMQPAQPTGPTPVEQQETMAKIEKLMAEVAKIKAETAASIVKMPQEMDHAERQMELAEKPEPREAAE